MLVIVWIHCTVENSSSHEELGPFGPFFIYIFGAKNFQPTAGCAGMRIYRISKVLQ